MMKRLLVIGGSGYIGERLLSRRGRAGIVATYHRKPIPGGIPFDVSTMRLADVVLRRNHGISHAILLQGINNIDYCASHSAETDEINVQGTIQAIGDLLDASVTPIFISSDAVFDGEQGFRSEDDAPNPILTYGRQKAAIEQYLSRQSSSWIVARLSKVVGSFSDRRNIMSEWLDSLIAGKRILCATDQILCPVDVDDVIEALILLGQSGVVGLYNVCGSQAISRYDLLQLLISKTEPLFAAAAKVEPCRLADLKLAERRPRDCTLSNRKLMSAFHINLRSLDEICTRLVVNYHSTKTFRTTPVSM
jgi:dTDP-4-dehydrorhamnose reductase